MEDKLKAVNQGLGILIEAQRLQTSLSRQPKCILRKSLEELVESVLSTPFSDLKGPSGGRKSKIGLDDYIDPNLTNR